jgi:hypothetical protein
MWGHVNVFVECALMRYQFFSNIYLLVFWILVSKLICIFNYFRMQNSNHKKLNTYFRFYFLKKKIKSLWVLESEDFFFCNFNSWKLEYESLEKIQKNWYLIKTHSAKTLTCFIKNNFKRYKSIKIYNKYWYKKVS